MNELKDLNQAVARKIIYTVGEYGIPPEVGFQYFTFGLDSYLTAIKEDYLDSYIKFGGSTFKMVVGAYGGGKTHFLYSIRDLSWKSNYVVSYVRLSPGECPFHRLDLVYKSIVRGLLRPLDDNELLTGYEQGIEGFLRSWYITKYKEYLDKGYSAQELLEVLKNSLNQISGIESLSFSNAVKSAFLMLMNNQEDDFIKICQWLLGENPVKAIERNFNIYQKIDKSTAFIMIRSLAKWIREIGFSGLIVLLDEAERLTSLSSGQKELHLNNLREIIDACGNANFQGVVVFYAVPDENFLEGRTMVYEALRQRLSSTFDKPNPTGVKIKLEGTLEDQSQFFEEVGQRLIRIYEIAYGCKFDKEFVDNLIGKIASDTFDKRFADTSYKRLFVKELITELNYNREKFIYK